MDNRRERWTHRMTESWMNVQENNVSVDVLIAGLMDDQRLTVLGVYQSRVL